jgi:hypothetical protein
VANPNISSWQLLLQLTSRWSVGIDAALDLGEAFLVAKDHRGDGDCASYNNRYDWDQQAT